MFTLEELRKDPSLLSDLKEDVREECAMLVDVTNFVLYNVRESIIFSPSHHGSPLTAPFFVRSCSKSQRGITTVEFRDPISAKTWHHR